MLDPLFRKLLDAPLNTAGQALARRGVRPNAVSFGGLIIGAAAMLALAFELYLAGLLLILLNRMFDGLDGPLARSSGPTDLGGYYDIVFDFLFYSGVIFGFAVGRPDQALPAAFLIFSFVGTGSSFLAYAIVAAKHKLVTEERGRKSFFHIGGLTEGSETIMTLVAICLFPDWFAWIAWIFGGLCWLTTAGRIVTARQAFGRI